MLLDDVKISLRITTKAFDDEISDLIAAAQDDLKLCGINLVTGDEDDPLIKRAITTYCRAHFGQPEDGHYDRLKRSYDEQKAQLQASQKWTVAI